MERDRFRGALLGLAVGDAVGTSVEFKPPGTFEPVRDMVGGGPFSLPAGAWTDDTSMALCLAESLIERGRFDPVDQLRRYVRWYRDGHWSSTGRCFDIGNATRAALERFERTGEPYPGDAAPDAAGNGPLMKLAPVVLAYASWRHDAVRLAGESARTTHGAPEAVDACRAFAALLLGALNASEAPRIDGLNPKAAAALGGAHVDGLTVAALGGPHIDGLHPKVLAALSSTREPPDVRGGGYVVDALEAALWALRSTSTFEDGVLAAVNLGDDADTTAAIYGQLAGAIYGLEGIPARWRERVHRGDEIVALADALFDQDVARPAIARFEGIRPAVIARCGSPHEVAEALGRARRSGLPVAVRGGGHDFAGRSSTTGVLIDTRPMNAIALDGELVTVGAGVRLGELYDALAAHGRTIAAGCGPTVGVTGLALGGGLGILGRKHGLTSDQWVAAQVVLADGRTLECDDAHHADLMWALRGAGGARFGVVTRLVLRTVPALTATALHLELPLARAAQTIDTWQQLDAPDELAASLYVLGGAVHVFGAHLGPRAEAAALLAPFGGTPHLEELGIRDVKRRLAETGPGEDLPFGRSLFVARPIPGDVFAAHPVALDFTPMRGAYNRIAAGATAFAHRDAFCCLAITGMARESVDRAYAAAREYGTGGVYPNFPEPERDVWDPAYHLANRDRLLALRDAYDPDRVFTR